MILRFRHGEEPPPLSYRVDSGAGTINPSTGIYATTQSGPATIKVTDAQNNSQTITINNKKIRFDGHISAIAQAGTSLYVGGNFSFVNLTAAPRMMVLDLDGKPKYGCDLQSGFDDEVTSVATSGESLYVGGKFTHYRGQSANRIAKLNLPSCELDTTFSPPGANGFDGNVYALTLSGSNLYVGGGFTAYKGITNAAKRIAKLDANAGALDTTFSPPLANGFDSTVYALVVYGSSLYVGGLFTDYRGVVSSANRLAKLNLTTGDLDTIFIPPGLNGFNDRVVALAVAGSSLYVGGWFTDYKGVADSAKRIAKLDLTTGALDTTFSPPGANGFDSSVEDLIVFGSSLYVGGAFSDYKGISNSANKIAKLDLTTGALDTTFSPPGANGFKENQVVFALAAAGSSLYVGGYFTDYRGVANSADYIAKLDLTTGAVDTTFSPPAANGFDSAVEALVVVGSSLYVGGWFFTYKGGADSAKNIAKLDLTSGAIDTTFSPPAANGFNSYVNALAVAGSSLYVGGDFTAYRGVANSANKIAKLDLTSGAIDTTFSPPAANGFDSYVNALAVVGSSLYVGGGFTDYRGVANSANKIAKLDLTSGAIDTTFSPPAANGFNSEVSAFAVVGSSLYVGGGLLRLPGRSKRPISCAPRSEYRCAGGSLILGIKNRLRQVIF